MTALPRSASPAIVYFGNDWFADNRTSSHHVARQLAARANVLYVECPGLRAPAASSRDAMRVVRKVARAFRPAIEVGEGLTVKTLVQWPAHGSPTVARLNRSWSRATAKWAMRALRPGALRSRGAPSRTSPASSSDLGARAIVYHCIDDYAALPGVDADGGAGDGRPAGALRRPGDCRLRAGVREPPRAEPEHHAGAPRRGLRSLRPRPLAMRCRCRPNWPTYRGPIVGFTGLIERWIDVDLIGWLAGEIPQATFVMVGRVAIPDEQLPSAPNLRWLGPRPYERLPEYGARFDAAIIPYRLNAQVHAANPLKLREYLSMGLPIVSVSTPEIDKFAEVVSRLPERARRFAMPW